MKKTFFIALTAILLVACNTKNTQQNNTQNTDSVIINTVINTSQNIELKAEKYEKIKCWKLNHIEKKRNFYLVNRISVEWPTEFGNKNIQVLQDSLLKYISVNSKDINDATLQFVNNLDAINFIDDAEQIQEIQETEIPKNCETWSIEETITCLNYSQKMITYQIYASSYLGGAHPYGSSKYVNFDIENNRELKIEDIIKSDLSEKFFNKCVFPKLNKFFKENDSSIEDGLLVSKKDIINNFKKTLFYFDNKNNMCIYFAPYEIACYAVGEIHISFTKNEIKDYLTNYALSVIE